MGILDELKLEADRVRKAKELEEARYAERVKIYQDEIRPRLLNIHRYLTELVKQLNVAEWAVMVSCQIPGIGKLENLKQGDYRITIDSLENPKKIAIHFACSASEERKFQVTPKSSAEETSNFLDSQRVLYTEWPIREGQHRQIIGAMFQAKLRFNCSLTFEVDEDMSKIKITSHNFENFTDQQFRIAYQTIDDNWLDQIGQYLLRKIPQLGNLFSSDAERELIRQRLELKKQHLQESAAAVELDPANTATEAGLLGRFWKLFRKPVS